MDGIKKKAALLIEALPYIQKHSGKIFVIKYGGNAMNGEAEKLSVISDIALLKHVGINPVIVHGGGPDLDREMRAAHLEPKFVNGLRYTDKKTLSMARKVFSSINREMRALLGAQNCPSIDATENLMQTRIQNPDLGLVGEVVRVNKEKLLLEIKDGLVPVISPIGFDGSEYNNINADSAASKIASALKAEKLTILTNVEGVFLDGKWASHLSAAQADEGIRSGAITKGMIPKVLACANAIRAGVGKAHLVDGTSPHSMLLEFFTNEGIGTEIVKENGEAAK